MAGKIRVELESDDTDGKALIELSLGSNQDWSVIESGSWLSQSGGKWASQLAPLSGTRLDVGAAPIGSLDSLHPRVAGVGQRGKGGIPPVTFDWKVTHVTA